VYDANGAIVGVSKISRDITARKQTEAELRRAQEELSRHADVLEKEVDARTASLREAIAQLEEFSYSVSHDLRAPLRAIAGYTQLLKNDFAPDLPETAHVFLDKISRSTERMQRLVNDVLTMSLVARSEANLHPVALQPFIEEILEQHPEMQAPQAMISITTPHKVIADEASLGQAVRNLLANAVKFVAPGTKPVVVVRSEKRNDAVRIWFEDNGIGINPEHQGKLFGMFQRLITDSRYEGTGIGLAIVRKAIERMGGAVGVEPGEKAGSRFWVELKESA
jgi:signal transduction histidine kinase